MKKLQPVGDGCLVLAGLIDVAVGSAAFLGESITTTSIALLCASNIMLIVVLLVVRRST